MAKAAVLVFGAVVVLLIQYGREGKYLDDASYFTAAWVGGDIIGTLWRSTFKK